MSQSHHSRYSIASVIVRVFPIRRGGNELRRRGAGSERYACADRPARRTLPQHLTGSSGYATGYASRQGHTRTSLHISAPSGLVAQSP